MRKSWQLDRRTFLRGAGTSLALPWLNGMAWATQRQSLPPGCVFYFHYGVPFLLIAILCEKSTPGFQLARKELRVHRTA